ncbi:PH domain-containing protein [Kineococcus sp. TBRC 1896]|uniref:PH domain-containing protein n=1 Tax=Kineococcus mangrovi TaxID=1660183 RepID=A0ABV4I2W1_9ACTN
MPPVTAGPVSDKPFRPRRARVVGLGFAVAILLVMVGMSIGLSLAPESGWTGQDTVSALVFGVVVSAGLVRLVTVNARVTGTALVVRNVVFTREVEWGAVVAVRFGGADPWLTLDLDDGDNLAVMAVQRADGEHARAEALRLARLVEDRAPR